MCPPKSAANMGIRPIVSRDIGASARRPKRRSPRPDWQSGSSQILLERVRDPTAKTLNGGEVVREARNGESETR